MLIHKYPDFLPVSAPPAAVPHEEMESRDCQTGFEKQVEKARQQIGPRAGQDFKVGDCVFISSLGRTGIVYEEANGKGEVGVMVMKRKMKVNVD